MGELGHRRYAGPTLLLLVCLTACPGGVEATERGLAAYPDGAQSFFCGMLPPPGSHFRQTVFYYVADHFHSADEPIDADFNAFVNVFSYVYSSGSKLWGGNWGGRVCLPLAYVHVGGREHPLSFSAHDFGVANTFISPLMLGYDLGDFHLTPTFSILPPGTWDPNNYASPSQNYWTFQPALGVAWMPKSGYAINLVLMYDLTTTNHDPLPPAKTSYKSGEAFHFDYTVDYAIRPNFRVGFAGFYYVQTSSDFMDGQNIGFRGRQFAIGPAVEYEHDSFSFSYSANFEMDTANRPHGVRNWLHIGYSF